MLYEMICGENPFYFDGMDQLALFEAICHEKYYPFPTQPSKELVDLVDGLLEKDPAQRLGMLAGGSEDILRHKWFDGMDLAKLRAREVRAPWRPPQAEDDFGNKELDDTQAQILKQELRSCLFDMPRLDSLHSLRELDIHEIDEEEEDEHEHEHSFSLPDSNSAIHEFEEDEEDEHSASIPISPPSSPLPADKANQMHFQSNLSPGISPYIRKPKLSIQDKRKGKQKSKERRATISGALLACLDNIDDIKDLDL
jgi:serine/threonine protein kinase